MVILATIDLMAVICSQLAFERIGRKMPYVLNMWLVGLLAVIASFLPNSKKNVKQESRQQILLNAEL
jgi:hypothetical protein